ASAHTDCLIQLLKSGATGKFVPGCEAAYLTLSSFSVKPYFSGLFTLSSQQVCVFVVTTDAHYREPSDLRKPYFIISCSSALNLDKKAIFAYFLSFLVGLPSY
ncbi:hypothetical protein SAMN05421680_12362, partial [Xenorhabdus mauleonii]